MLSIPIPPNQDLTRPAGLLTPQAPCFVPFLFGLKTVPLAAGAFFGLQPLPVATGAFFGPRTSRGRRRFFPHPLVNVLFLLSPPSPSPSFPSPSIFSLLALVLGFRTSGP